MILPETRKIMREGEKMKKGKTMMIAAEMLCGLLLLAAPELTPLAAGARTVLLLTEGGRAPWVTGALAAGAAFLPGRVAFALRAGLYLLGDVCALWRAPGPLCNARMWAGICLLLFFGLQPGISDGLGEGAYHLFWAAATAFSGLRKMRKGAKLKKTVRNEEAHHGSI